MPGQQGFKTFLAVLLASVLGCLSPAPLVADTFDEHANPELASQFVPRPEASAQRFMVSTANPLATRAGYDILARGGGAIDAAIAAQLVLNLVEPQSSGIGGGAFIVYYSRLNNTLTSYDGRETAPAAVSDQLFVDAAGRSLGFAKAINSGLSVGVPGLLRVLEMAHQKQGLLPWAQLFQPAIQLAQDGFSVSPRLNFMLRHSRSLFAQPAARAYFFDAAGQPWPVGHRLRNPAFARTLQKIANEGADAFYRGELAEAMVGAVRAHERPGLLARADLAAYQAIERAPLCGQYREYTLCGMGPPSSGTLAVLQMLGILQHFPMRDYAPLSPQAVHYFAEAGRLAYADRDYYVADPASVDVPWQSLLDPTYLQARAALIRPDASLGEAPPGQVAERLPALGKDNALERPSTTHLSIVDAWGDVLSMTSTIESAFGSKIFVEGFLLNNELTDFSLPARDEAGRLRANRLQPGKRPRSSMTPLIVFRGGQPVMAIGSPGGSAIINYVAQTLLGVFEWDLGLQEAIAMPHYGSRNGPLELERGRGLEGLEGPLQALGHELLFTDFPSGLQGILIAPDRLRGGADPRREGVAEGN